MLLGPCVKKLLIIKTVRRMYYNETKLSSAESFVLISMPRFLLKISTEEGLMGIS